MALRIRDRRLSNECRSLTHLFFVAAILEGVLALSIPGSMFGLFDSHFFDVVGAAMTIGCIAIILPLTIRFLDIMRRLSDAFEMQFYAASGNFQLMSGTIQPPQ